MENSRKRGEEMQIINKDEHCLETACQGFLVVAPTLTDLPLNITIVLYVCLSKRPIKIKTT